MPSIHDYMGKEDMADLWADVQREQSEQARAEKCPEDGDTCNGRGCRWCPDRACLSEPLTDYSSEKPK